MSDEITRDDIYSLPHQAKIAYAARCARIAWGFSRCTHFPWQTLSDDLHSVLQTVERWGESITECDSAKRCHEKPAHIRIHEEKKWSGEEEKIYATFQSLQKYSTIRDPNKRYLISAIEESFETSVSPRRNPGEDGAATYHANKAYGMAHEAARYSSHLTEFESIAKKDFEKLKNHCDDNKDCLGDVPPAFFPSLDEPA